MDYDYFNQGLPEDADRLYHLVDNLIKTKHPDKAFSFCNQIEALASTIRFRLAYPPVGDNGRDTG